MQVLGGIARDASPGLLRLSGSFTTNSSGTPINSRPSKGEFTVTREAAGVYVVKFNQPTQSIVWGWAEPMLASAIVGGGAVALATTELGVCNVSGDFMGSDGTHYSADTSNSEFLILVYNAASNHTSLTLTDVYALTAGNTGGVANTRIGFEVCFATSTINS